MSEVESFKDRNERIMKQFEFDQKQNIENRNYTQRVANDLYKKRMSRLTNAFIVLSLVCVVISSLIGTNIILISNTTHKILSILGVSATGMFLALMTYKQRHQSGSGYYSFRI